MRDDEEVVRKLTEKNKEPITSKQGQKRAKEIKAKAYMEYASESNHFLIILDVPLVIYLLSTKYFKKH
jgi:hypothetical protein